jgi:hypothetical protein
MVENPPLERGVENLEGSNGKDAKETRTKPSVKEETEDRLASP